MNGPLRAFLQKQFDEAMAFAADSDVVDLIPVEGRPPDKYIAMFHSPILVRGDDGEITVAEDFAVGFSFRSDYLSRVDPLQTISWLGPDTVFHPNLGRGRFAFGPVAICLGKVAPATSIVNLLYQVHDVTRYGKYTLVEWDALNVDACQWARKNINRFPISSRPLKRPRGRDVIYQKIVSRDE